MAQEQEYADALPEGYKLEGYEIVRVLGVGGFGMTYLGFDDNLNKAVAIKEYLPGEISRRDASLSVTPRSSNDKTEFEWGLERFVSEAQDIARFNHPNIISVYRFFRAHGTAYIVMDYAEGEPLSQLLKRENKLNEAELKKVLFPILDGVEEVHKLGLIHRDIKPDNIIIRDDGVPVLIDFGAARQQTAERSRSMTAVLTPGYAPPEQYSTKGKQGAWTDVYALAAVAYRALTGSKPEDSPDRLLENEYVPATEAGKGQASLIFLRAIDCGLSVKAHERPQTIAYFRSLLVGERGTPSVASTKKGSQKKKYLRRFIFASLIGLAIIVWNANTDAPPHKGQELVRAVQEELARLDYTIEVDGVFGAGTRRRIQAFQREEGYEVKGTVNTTLLARLKEAKPLSGIKGRIRAARWGTGEVKDNLGRTYFYGEDGMEKNYQKAFKWFRLSAEQGYSSGQSNLGHMYRNGKGVAKNYQKAVQWYRLAAEQGNEYGQNVLGLMYQKGEGVAKNHQKAVQWWRLSAEQGNAHGQSSLGTMYYHGTGVEKNYQKAVQWFRLSAEQGNASAQDNLGTMYYFGYGLEKNYQKAFKWYRLSAEQGNASAQGNLGGMYHNGEGVRANLDKACKWYRKAIAQGHNEVKQSAEVYC